MNPKTPITGPRPRAVLMDFYGTLVEEDNVPIGRICDQIAQASALIVTPEEVRSFWGRVFGQLCSESFGSSFRPQKELEQISLRRILGHFQAELDVDACSRPLYEYWAHPTMCPESRSVLEQCDVPVCLVSNIDNAELRSALKHNDLRFDQIVTSEDCRAYKPRREMFRKALSLLGVQSGEAIHVGDSFASDVLGARAMEMPALWVNRSNKAVPTGEAPPEHTSKGLGELVTILHAGGRAMKDDEIRLIEPAESLRAAYIDYLEECEAAGERPKTAEQRRQILTDFAGYVQKRRRQSRGVGLPEGWVPQTTYWLVRGGRILAASGLRHRLTEALLDWGGNIGYAVRPSERGKGYATLMLKRVLDKARQLGLQRVLITCDKRNIASARVIQKNGGRLDSESFSPQAGRVTQRYWVELSNPPQATDQAPDGERS